MFFLWLFNLSAYVELALRNPLEGARSRGECIEFILANINKGLFTFEALTTSKVISILKRISEPSLQEDKTIQRFLGEFPSIINRKVDLVGGLLIQPVFSNKYLNLMIDLEKSEIKESFQLNQAHSSVLQAFMQQMYLEFLNFYLSKLKVLSPSLIDSFVSIENLAVESIRVFSDSQVLSLKNHSIDTLFDDTAIMFLGNFHALIALCNNPELIFGLIKAPGELIASKISKRFEALSIMFQEFLKSLIANSIKNVDLQFFTKVEVGYLEQELENPKLFFTNFCAAADSFCGDRDIFLKKDGFAWQTIVSVFENYSYWLKFSSCSFGQETKLEDCLELNKNPNELEVALLEKKSLKGSFVQYFFKGSCLDSGGGPVSFGVEKGVQSSDYGINKIIQTKPIVFKTSIKKPRRKRKLNILKRLKKRLFANKKKLLANSKKLDIEILEKSEQVLALEKIVSALKEDNKVFGERLFDLEALVEKTKKIDPLLKYRGLSRFANIKGCSDNFSSSLFQHPLLHLCSQSALNDKALILNIYKMLDLKILTAELMLFEEATKEEVSFAFWALCKFILKQEGLSSPSCKKLITEAFQNSRVMSNLFCCFLYLIRSIECLGDDLIGVRIKDKLLLDKALSFLLKDRDLNLNSKQFICAFLSCCVSVSGIDIIKELKGW